MKEILILIMFLIKQGVCRVIAQIILSIFSLNTKESGKLNDVGKIEASKGC